MDAEPLFPPGFHDIELQALEEIFVRPFPSSLRRPKLLSGLSEVLSILHGFAMPLEIWLNGSFATKKQEPDDVDALIIANLEAVNSLSNSHQQFLKELTDNKAYAKSVFFGDFFLMFDDDLNMRSYWRGLFGFDRAENPKGIPRLIL